MSNGISNESTGSSPYALAMVVCDSIWRDPYTGKMTIIGTFSAIGGPSFPLVHPIISVYVTLTDGRGKLPVILKLVDIDEMCDPVFELCDEVEFEDPRAIVEIGFQACNIQIPQAGEYRLQLFANEEFVIERQILVVGPSERTA